MDEILGMPMAKFIALIISVVFITLIIAIVAWKILAK